MKNSNKFPDVLTFRNMLTSFIVKDVNDAVFARHYAQDMEAAAERMKDQADEVLYNLDDNAMITAKDADGNVFAVKFMPQNQKAYTQTKELKDALAAFQSAKEYLAEVQKVTPFKMVAKGEKGYSYKVVNPNQE